jgi:hypothetical protein
MGDVHSVAVGGWAAISCRLCKFQAYVVEGQLPDFGASNRSKVRIFDTSGFKKWTTWRASSSLVPEKALWREPAD